ncbi:MAG TPA: hypothetical protein VKF81_03300 [Blastocatellia bacterium]|nr:hypothetical protein [Blastocatellia bacterium]
MTGLDLKVEPIKQGRKQIEIASELGIHLTRSSRIENNWDGRRPQIEAS